MLRRRTLVAFALPLISYLCACGASRAEDWPSKPVKIVAAFGAGGTADELGRLLAPELSTTFNQQFYVENRPGNSGSIGSTVVARSAPDGYTLLIGGAGPLLIGPAINPNISYNTMRDFTHIALIVGDTFMLAVSPALKAKSLTDLLAIAKDRPLPCGAVGAGSQGDLLQQIIKREVGIESDARAIQGRGREHGRSSRRPCDVLGCDRGGVRRTSEGGQGHPDRTRGRASAALHFQDVPTFTELGFPNISGVAWFWLAGPKNLPPDVVDKLNRDVRRIIQLPKAKEMFAKATLVTKDADAATVDAFIGDEVAKWGKVSKEIGLTVQ